jgi:hypothetical protein
LAVLGVVSNYFAEDHEAAHHLRKDTLLLLGIVL